VYGSLLKGDSTPCGQTGLIYCTCDHNNGPCYASVQNSGPQRGCVNSAPGNTGAQLTAVGVPSVLTGVVSLIATDMTGPGLFFQGTGKVDIPFGDGRLCVGGSIIRMGVVFPVGGVAAYPGASTPIQIAGAIPFFGGVRNYQVWYRDSGPHCTIETFNLTNGYTINWAP